MIKWFYRLALAIITLVTALSCASKNVIGEGTVNNELTGKKVIKNHYANSLEFKTIKGKLKISYDDGDSSKSFSVNLRMEKDKAIWMSESFLGAVKAYITPTGVSFYNKLDNTYFDGDFQYISDLLGTTIDFEKLQNVLIGQCIFDLKEDKYSMTIAGNRYQFKPDYEMALYKTLFQIEPKYYKMALQQVAQPQDNRVSTIFYNSYQEVDGKPFPNQIQVVVEEPGSKTTIEIEYKNIEFDQEVSFPYDIPNGYKQITLEK